MVKISNASDEGEEVVVTDEEEEEEEAEEEVDYELDDYNSNEDSDYTYSEQDGNAVHSSEGEQGGAPRTRQQSRATASGASSSTDSNYGLFLIAIILGGVLVSVVPLYFYDPPTSSSSSSPSSSSPKSQSSPKGSPTVTPLCPLPEGQRLYTKAELATYTAPPAILLGFLGVVYDVTAGGSYYQPPDGAYSFFAGKDGTRGFLTGEFTADQLVDDITDLGEDSSLLSGLDTWIALYEEKYRRVGLLVGAYYDIGGCPTEKAKWVEKRMAQAKEAAKGAAAAEKDFPPCNSQWDAASKSGRVWCSTASGGINRPWTGRPRQFYSLASKSWRCACLQEDGDVPQEDWCDGVGNGQNEKPNVKKAKTATGVKYAPGEEGAGANCLWKHYQGCDAQALECPIAD